MPKSGRLGDADPEKKQTALEYSPEQADQALELSDIMGLPESVLQPGERETHSQGLPAIVLRPGAGFKGADMPIATDAKAPSGVPKPTADKVECAGRRQKLGVAITARRGPLVRGSRSAS